MALRLVMLWLMAASAAGCNGSPWAREDPDYAAKYPHHTGNLAKLTKQAVDARHVEGKSGYYAGVWGRGDPFAVGGEAGMFRYPRSYLEVRGGLGGLIYEGETPVSGGVLGGVRLQSPSRLAPFVGLGGYAGVAPELMRSDDGLDNDVDGFVDESDEAPSDFVLAAMPEAGVHFWMTPEWRVTTSASYFAELDDQNDFLLFSVSLARLTDPSGPTSTRGLAKAAEDGGWLLGDGPNAAEYSGSQDALLEVDSPGVLPPPVAE